LTVSKTVITIYHKQLSTRKGLQVLTLHRPLWLMLLVHSSGLFSSIFPKLVYPVSLSVDKGTFSCDVKLWRSKCTTMPNIYVRGHFVQQL